ncbi:MAG TPA: phosphodiester glycosidase family protein [Polyangia bacterium]
MTSVARQLFFLALGGVALARGPSPSLPAWRALAPGVEYAELHDPAAPADTLQVVRVDPARATLRAVMASARDRRPRTAGAWCDAERLVAAINLGMYREDHLTNVGYARSGAHVNQPHVVTQYQSALVFGPRRPGLPPAALLDLDAPHARERLDDYDTVVQNLRLIRAPGRSVWSAQPRRWSEAAVASDGAGRILFVFLRAPRTMSDFNRLLLALPLGVVAAMHVEGGPEASLSVRGPLHLDANGSYETGFVENDGERRQWEIPNVLGVAATAP